MTEGENGGRRSFFRFRRLESRRRAHISPLVPPACLWRCPTHGCLYCGCKNSQLPPGPSATTGRGTTGGRRLAPLARLPPPLGAASLRCGAAFVHPCTPPAPAGVWTHTGTLLQMQLAGQGPRARGGFAAVAAACTPPPAQARRPSLNLSLQCSSVVLHRGAPSSCGHLDPKNVGDSTGAGAGVQGDGRQDVAGQGGRRGGRPDSNAGGMHVGRERAK